MRPNNLAYLHRDRGYRWSGDVDADLDFIRQIIFKSGKSIGEILDDVYDASQGRVIIAHSTIAKWLDGTTRRPRNWTLHWVALALGYERQWITKRNSRP